MSNLVQLPITHLQDIPTLLRNLAHNIEIGEYNKVDTVYVVIPRTDDFPRLFGYGDVDGDSGPLTQLLLMQHWLCQNLASR